MKNPRLLVLEVRLVIYAIVSATIHFTHGSNLLGIGFSLGAIFFLLGLFFDYRAWRKQ